MTNASNAQPIATDSPLGRRLPAAPLPDADDILDRFLDWVSEIGFELFPAQEEALLELMAGRHVILDTPTGSGKSLVAVGLHFKAMCEGRVSFYTSPIKALASEKFFQLCDAFGAENVGMLTGDASINAAAPIRCCTAEVLSNMALRLGRELRADAVVMDEFHYYADPERGTAWQVPLLLLPETQFLLMSATLGNPAPIQERLDRDTSRTSAIVSSVERPVPLEFDYRETPLHETVQDLLDRQRAPIYIVNFTQRECAERAQSLTSLKATSKEEKSAILEAIGDFRFDSAYGKEMRRFLSHGIAVHHAGLLPKYRLLVEQLAQRGLLKAICGTDTLGVGVNVPIRTVLFTRLCKFDGEKVGILKVRDFKQIAGRAGRKGFDDEGFVVCQAPEHVIENRMIDRKRATDPKKAKKLVKKKPPLRGFVPWSKETFESLIARPPETLRSSFRVGHGLILELLQRDEERNDPDARNFQSLRELIARCHEDDDTKQRLITESAQLVRSLYRAGIVRLVRDASSRYLWVATAPELQLDFSLHHNLSIYLVQTLELVDRQSPDYPLDVLSLVEAILENPTIVLLRQEDKLKDQLIARLKAEGVEYEERMAQLEKVTYPKPCAELLYATFNQFRDAHPWIAGDNIRPKGVAREIYADFLSFEDFVRRYGIQRFEGVLLRYLSQVFRTLTQNVPESFKTDELYDLLGFFRALLNRVDSSLLEEWEGLLGREAEVAGDFVAERDEATIQALELLTDERAIAARVRAELHLVVRALARREWEEAALHLEAESPVPPWTPERLDQALQPFFAEHDNMIFTPEARQAHLTRLEQTSPTTWDFSHVLLDPTGDNLWCLEGCIDLGGLLDSSARHGGPLLRLRRIGT